MPTLRTPVKFLEVIMNKKKPEEQYMILHEGLHNVWVIDVEGKKEPFELPKRIVNMTYIKVDPKAVKVLFSERMDENINDNPTYEPTVADEGQGG